MDKTSEPGGIARRGLLRRAVAAATLIAGASRHADAAEVEVMIDNFAFAPSLLTVTIGTDVTWINHDDIPHSIVCRALAMKSRTLDTDERFTYRFERAGTFDYICGLHPHMMGKVLVRD